MQSQQVWHQRWLSSLEQLAVACPCGTCQQLAVMQRLLSLVGSLPEPLPESIALLCGRATCASLPARWALDTSCSLPHGGCCVASFKHLTASYCGICSVGWALFTWSKLVIREAACVGTNHADASWPMQYILQGGHPFQLVCQALRSSIVSCLCSSVAHAVCC